MRFPILIGAIFVILVATAYWLAPHPVAHETRAETILSQCAGKIDCMSDALTDVVLTEDTGRAFNILRAMFVMSPQVPPSCFMLSSQIGEKVAAQERDFAQLSLRPESVYCNYGFYQSYSRERLLATKDTSAAKDFCEYVAMKLDTYSTDASVECYRGMGHALPFIRDELNGDVSKMAASAVASCEAFVPEGRAQEACFSGVFSRLGLAERNEWWGISVHPKDPLGLCREVSDTHKPFCLGNYKRTIMDPEVEPVSLSATLESLREDFSDLSNEDVAGIAFTVGYDKAKMQSGHLNYGELIAACSSDDSSLERECRRGLAVGIAKNGTPGEQDTEVLALCRRGERVDASVCPSENALQYMKGFFPPERFRSICKALELEEGICAAE